MKFITLLSILGFVSFGSCYVRNRRQVWNWQTQQGNPQGGWSNGNFQGGGDWQDFPGQNQNFPGNDEFPSGGNFPGNGQIFPGSGQNFPGSGNRPRPTQATTTPPTATNDVTTSSPEYLACLKNCPSTPQYSPVCGSNRVTYNNRARLECARRCGMSK